MYRFALPMLFALVCAAQPSSFTISTVAGTGTPDPNGTPGSELGDNGAATSAYLNTPVGVALDSAHNIYIADAGNERIRKVTASTGKISTVAGGGGVGYAGDGGAATSASLWDPYGVWVDSQGNIFIADLSNQLVREVTASNGNINTFAGNTGGGGFSGDGGPAAGAQLEYPWGVVGDNKGTIYIADSNNNRIRVVTPDGNIHTYAGNGVGSYAGDGGKATAASLHQPFGIALDSAGNLYISDYQNNRIREVTTDGNIKTVAGNGKAGFSGDGGLAVNAELNGPYGLAVDSSGDIFIADYNNNRVREVTTNGIINTVAGTGAFGYSGDSGAATAAKLNFPTGVAVDNSTGNLYIVDSSNAVIRMLTPQAPAVSGVASASDFGNFSSVAPGSWVQIYGTNLSTDARLWGSADFKGSTAPSGLDGTTITIGGQPATVDYISGGQVNAQVPVGVNTGSQPVVVKTPFGTSSSTNVTVNTLQPGLWAPAVFKANNVQYVGALFPDGVTYAMPAGAVAGLPSRPAKAGDIITVYGVGFGPVNNNVPLSGQVVQTNNSLTTPVQFYFGQAPATAQYEGLAPSFVGLYQFNLIVPGGLPAGNTPLTFTLGGVSGTQTVYVALQ